MKEEYLNRLLNNPEEVDNKIDEYPLNKIIARQEPEKEEIAGHLLKAEHNIRFLQDISNMDYSDWVIVGCYYACYHTALAMIQKKGFNSKNHDATLCLLIKYYYKDKLSDADLMALNNMFLDNQEILFYVQTKDEREKASYSTRINFDKKIVNELKIKTLLFVNKCKEVLNN